MTLWSRWDPSSSCNNYLTTLRSSLRALLWMPVWGRKGRIAHASSLSSRLSLFVHKRLVHTHVQGQYCAAAACWGISGKASYIFLSITSTYGLNSFHLYIVCKNNWSLLHYRDGHTNNLQIREQTFRVANLNPLMGNTAAEQGRAGLAMPSSISWETGSTFNASFAIPLQVILTLILWPWISWALASGSAWQKLRGTWLRWKALTRLTPCALDSSLTWAPVPPRGKPPPWPPPWPTTTTPCTLTTGQLPFTTFQLLCCSRTDSTPPMLPHADSPRTCPRTALPCSRPPSPTPTLPSESPPLAASLPVSPLSPPPSCPSQLPFTLQRRQLRLLPRASPSPSPAPSPCFPPARPPLPWLQRRPSLLPWPYRPLPAPSRLAAGAALNPTDPGGLKLEPFKSPLSLPGLVPSSPSAHAHGRTHSHTRARGTRRVLIAQPKQGTTFTQRAWEVLASPPRNSPDMLISGVGEDMGWHLLPLGLFHWRHLGGEAVAFRNSVSILACRGFLGNR